MKKSSKSGKVKDRVTTVSAEGSPGRYDKKDKRGIGEYPAFRKSIPATSAKISGDSKFQKKRIGSKKSDKIQSELGALKRIRTTLSKENVDVLEVARALKVVKRERLTVADFLLLVKTGEDLRRRHGKSYSSIIEDYAEKADLIEKASTKLDGMQREESKLEQGISRLKALERLQVLLNQHQSDADALADYVEEYREFANLGFDLKTMTAMIDELVRLGHDPVESGKTIGAWLSKSRTIAEATLRAEQSLDAIKNEESLTISRIENLVRKAEDAQKRIDALENYYASRSQSLEAEYENRQRALDARASEERRRAEAETFAILRERDKLRSENRLLKEEEESVRKEIDLARAISSLVRNPRAITSSQLETITLELAHVKAGAVGKDNSATRAHERLLEARRLFLLALQETIDA